MRYAVDALGKAHRPGQKGGKVQAPWGPGTIKLKGDQTI